MSVTTEQAIKHLSIHLQADVDCYNQAAAKGYMRAAAGHKRDMEVHKIAIAALREKAEREKNEPLTLDELRQMDGNPVWVVDKTGKPPDMGGWCVMYEDASCALVPGCECWEWDVKVYGKTWIAYRHKPKEAEHEASDAEP